MTIAERTDPTTGATETVKFIGPPGDRTLLHSHRPAGPTTRTLTICPSLFTDFLANYPREVALARALTQYGVTTYRFHYRGSGNSDGDPLDMSIDRMVEDAQRVAQVGASDHPSVPGGFLGSRMGAFVAALVVADRPSNEPLILWEPVIEARRFFKDAFRAEAMRNLKEQNTTATSTLKDDLRSQGWIDLLGYAVPQSLVDATETLDLNTAVGDQPRPVLFVDMGAATQSRSPANICAEALADRGFDVTSDAAASRESWWFAPADTPDDDALIALTTQWIVGIDQVVAS